MGQDMLEVLVEEKRITLAEATQIREELSPPELGEDLAHAQQEARFTRLTLARRERQREEMRRKLIAALADCPFCGRPSTAHAYTCLIVRD